MTYEVKVDIFKNHENVVKEVVMDIDAPDPKTARLIALKMAKAAHPDMFHFAWEAAIKKALEN
jgi:hypothetical protein